MKTYKLEITHSVIVEVEAPDEETAVHDAGELAGDRYRAGEGKWSARIISER